ncbi:probable Gamma-interferon-inducible lysosomal thiol reductase [Coccomyxa sp. Obi]|nr:probable Gamma-interferon-inducible lysosomal thiol reductase [Coccomyxa sp. Obi]
MSGPERRFVFCIVFSLAAIVASGSLLLRSRSLDLGQSLPITTGSSKSHPVRVDFIGEALCPDCAAFTAKVLEPIFSSGLSELINFDFVGWGNAKNNSGEIKCQHGPKECELNIVLNCAQHLSKSQEVFFSFLSCLEKKAFRESSADVLQSCTSDEKLSEKALQECAFGGQGKELEKAAEAATPAHPYVPWVLVDGVPLGPDCGNLATYICTAYKGEKPKECHETPEFKPCPGIPARDKSNAHLSL